MDSAHHHLQWNQISLPHLHQKTVATILRFCISMIGNNFKLTWKDIRFCIFGNQFLSLYAAICWDKYLYIIIEKNRRSHLPRPLAFQKSAHQGPTNQLREYNYSQSVPK